MKSYRIRTDINKEPSYINIALEQDFDEINILSVKIDNESVYNSLNSSYGVIVGRVYANGGFGVPNAKVSIFIPQKDLDNDILNNNYPFKSFLDKKSGKQYNLLTNTPTNNCHSVVGTFNTKRDILDNSISLELFENYYKLTTTTNNSGDYMLFGVPVGIQNVHVDIDLSDIGVLSQKPRDFLYKGYNKGMFENPNKFKTDGDLSTLPQVVQSNTTIDIKSFWGDESYSEIGITRCDVEVNYKFEPTCVFIGSIFTDDDSNSIQRNCTCKDKIGQMDELITSEGTIEMVRESLTGEIEYFVVQGNELVDSNGTWCYQIPMNLDYMITDEYGDLIPSEDPTKGIPTRTSARFRINLRDINDLDSSTKIASQLVPNTIDGVADLEDVFSFDENPNTKYFRDLLWNKVYTVKSYIPRIQKTSLAKRIQGGNQQSTTRQQDNFSRKFMGIKSINTNKVNNYFPYNRTTVVKKTLHRIMCELTRFAIDITKTLNSFKLRVWDCIKLTGFAQTQDGGDYIFVPGCSGKDWGKLVRQYECQTGEGKVNKDVPARFINCNDGIIISRDKGEAIELTQSLLSEEYDIVNMDFYNDWVNGVLWSPKFKTKNKRRNKKEIFCDFDSKKRIKSLSLFNACSIPQRFLSKTPIPCNNSGDCHKELSEFEYGSKGLIKKISSDEFNDKFYYVPAFFSKSKKITLFENDLVLLGSLVDCDIHKIPKITHKIPATTYKIPPYQPELDDPTNDIRSGVIVESGIDMIGPKGDKISDRKERESRGLFYDINCTKFVSRAKTCVNAIRICELGVDVDELYQIPYNDFDDDNGIEVKPDGYININELGDFNSKSIFASLNSIKLKVKEPYSSYDITENTIKNITNFDGLLENTHGVSDRLSEDYLKFRCGVDSLDKIEYYDGEYKMPVFKNSFYLYFGLKKGMTAVDRLYSDFFADCPSFKQEKFSVNIKRNHKSLCSDDAFFEVNIKGGSGYYTISVYDLNNKITPLKQIHTENKYYKFNVSELVNTSIDVDSFNFEVSVYDHNLDKTINKFVSLSINDKMTGRVNVIPSYLKSKGGSNISELNTFNNSYLSSSKSSEIINNRDEISITYNYNNPKVLNVNKISLNNIVDYNSTNFINIKLYYTTTSSSTNFIMLDTFNNLNVFNLNTVEFKNLPPLVDGYYICEISASNCAENYFTGIDSKTTEDEKIIFEGKEFKKLKIEILEDFDVYIEDINENKYKLDSTNFLTVETKLITGESISYLVSDKTPNPFEIKKYNEGYLKVFVDDSIKRNVECTIENFYNPSEYWVDESNELRAMMFSKDLFYRLKVRDLKTDYIKEYIIQMYYPHIEIKNNTVFYNNSVADIKLGLELGKIDDDILREEICGVKSSDKDPLKISYQYYKGVTSKITKIKVFDNYNENKILNGIDTENELVLTEVNPTTYSFEREIKYPERVPNSIYQQQVVLYSEFYGDNAVNNVIYDSFIVEQDLFLINKVECNRDIYFSNKKDAVNKNGYDVIKSDSDTINIKCKVDGGAPPYYYSVLLRESNKNIPYYDEGYEIYDSYTDIKTRGVSVTGFIEINNLKDIPPFSILRMIVKDSNGATVYGNSIFNSFIGYNYEEYNTARGRNSRFFEQPPITIGYNPDSNSLITSLVGSPLALCEYEVPLSYDELSTSDKYTYALEVVNEKYDDNDYLINSLTIQEDYLNVKKSIKSDILLPDLSFNNGFKTVPLDDLRITIKDSLNLDFNIYFNPSILDYGYYFALDSNYSYGRHSLTPIQNSTCEEKYLIYPQMKIKLFRKSNGINTKDEEVDIASIFGNDLSKFSIFMDYVYSQDIIEYGVILGGDGSGGPGDMIPSGPKLTPFKDWELTPWPCSTQIDRYLTSPTTINKVEFKIVKMYDNKSYELQRVFEQYGYPYDFNARFGTCDPTECRSRNTRLHSYKLNSFSSDFIGTSQIPENKISLDKSKIIDFSKL